MANKLLSALVLVLLLASCSNSTDVETTDTSDASANKLSIDPASALCTQEVRSPHIPAGDVLNLAKDEEAGSYKFVQDKDAEIISIDDDKSFVVWWQPEDFDVSTDTVVVSLHGHGSWATRDFEVWYPQVSKNNYAYLGLQWWFGRSLEKDGYYNDENIYELIGQVLEQKGVEPGHVIFEGFSMGSARAYAVSLYDATCSPEPYFALSIANSGPWEDDYPLYSDILDGQYGENPFEGTHWILFCGEQDYNDEGIHQGPVCDGMDHTQDVLTQLGGSVELFLKDPNGDHGSFSINSANSTKALETAETFLNE